MAPADHGGCVLFQYGNGEKGYDISEDGHRRLKQPRGVSIDADGRLLVADYGSHCIVRFHSDDVRGKVVAGEAGKILPTVDILKDIDRPLGPAEGEGFLMKRPIDVCSHEKAGYLVLDTEVSRVQHYASQDEKAATVVPPPNQPPQRSVHTPEAIKYPRSFQLRPNGDIIVCDTWSHRILRYASDGSSPEVLAGKPNSCGSTSELLHFPSGVAFDSEGRLYVSDTNNHRVQCFAPGQSAGVTVAGSAEGVAGTGLGQLNMPTGVCIDPRDGSIIVADRMNSRVLRFRAGACEGEVVVGAQQKLERPWGVCQDTSGAVYVSDERASFVLKVELPEKLSSTPEAHISMSAKEPTPVEAVSAASGESPLADSHENAGSSEDHNALD
jgi:sugar lactone lactonase YvrE